MPDNTSPEWSEVVVVKSAGNSMEDGLSVKKATEYLEWREELVGYLVENFEEEEELLLIEQQKMEEDSYQAASYKTVIKEFQRDSEFQNDKCLLNRIPDSVLAKILKTLCRCPWYGGHVDVDLFKAEVYNFFLAHPKLYHRVKGDEHIASLIGEAFCTDSLNNFYEHYGSSH